MRRVKRLSTIHLSAFIIDNHNAVRYIITVHVSRYFYTVLFIITCLQCFAASEETTGATPQSRWSLEGSLQAHSVAGPSSPWMGFGPLFRTSESTQLGLRGFVPVTQPFDKSIYSLQSFLRIRLHHGANTDLFLEPDFALNFYTMLPFSSYGLAVGVLNRISPDFSIGMSGGLETAEVVIDSIGLERRNTPIVYPKITVFTNFNL